MKISDSGDFIAVSQLSEKKPMTVFLIRKVNTRDVEIDVIKSRSIPPEKTVARLRITMKPNDGYAKGRTYLTKSDTDTEAVHEAFLRISKILGKKMTQKSILTIDNKDGDRKPVP